jgi:hypothetical protein
MTNDLIAIRWKNPESKNYIDLLAFPLFAKEGTTKQITHTVLGPQGGHHRAKCRLVVSSTTAELDYEVFPEFNKWWGMYLGVLRLEFTNSKRDTLTQIYWRDQGHKQFVIAPVDVVNKPLPPIPPYQPTKSTAQKVIRKIQERPGQAQFRFTLMMAYGGQCCISGCSVSEALEGAHIDPFSGKLSDHPQNGLLLRSDLHALFDAGLMAIEPTSRLVHFVASARVWPEYKNMHKVARLAEPIYGGPSYKPSEEALKRRWRDFNRTAKQNLAA